MLEPFVLSDHDWVKIRNSASTQKPAGFGDSIDSDQVFGRTQTTCLTHLTRPSQIGFGQASNSRL